MTASDGRADLVLTGGKIRSPAHPSGFVQALAVRGGLIHSVGTDEEIRRVTGPRTRVVELGGRLAVPAFGDAHVHAVAGGLEGLRCNLVGLRTRQESLAAVASYCAGLGPGDWVLGGGWTMSAFPGGLPTAADLDPVTGGRPAFLPNRDHHTAWVNTAALERAGVDARTPDPPDGRIERDAAGPQARCTTGPCAWSRTWSRRPERPSCGPACWRPRRTCTRWGSPGSRTRAWGRPPSSASRTCSTPTGRRPRTACSPATWSARCGGIGPAGWARSTTCWPAGNGPTGTRAGGTRAGGTRAAGRRAGGTGRAGAGGRGRFRATTVKLMLDGVCETFTAAMSAPYLGRHGERGRLFIDQDTLREATGRLAAEGFQLHFHAIGDLAVSTALDALEALPAEQRRAGRHHLAHLQFIAPRDMGRFRALDAVANFQPLWACNEPQMEELTLPFVGPERAAWQYLIGSLVRGGTRIAFGSDWPISSADPLQEMHVAVNRVKSERLGRPGEPECEDPFLPAQAITVDEAIGAFTSGVDWVNHEEDQTGTAGPRDAGRRGRARPGSVRDPAGRDRQHLGGDDGGERERGARRPLTQNLNDA